MLSDSTSRRNHARARRSTYRSARAVRPDTHFVSEWTRRKFIVFLVGTSLLAVFTVLPIVLVDIPMDDNHHHHHLTNDNKAIGNTGHVGLSSLLRKSSEIQQNWKQFLEKEKEVFQEELEKDLPILFHQHHMRPAESLPPQEDPKMISKKDQIQQKPPIVVLSQAVQKEKTTTKQLNKPPNNTTIPLLARGVAGLPFSQTPALWGAQRGHIICDSPIDQNDLAYWNDPVGIRDLQFQTPFISVNQKNKLSSPTESFLSFQPDPGGWNNVRMSFESMVVFAAATGRTLILPPRAPFYLLAWGKEGARTYGNFWSMSSLERRIPIISMKEFVTKYGTSILGLTDERQRKEVEPLADICLYQHGAPDHCNNLWKYFHPVGWQPPFQVAKECLVFDENIFQGRPIRPSDEAKVTRFCGSERTPIYYNSTWTQPQLMHWDATGVETYRLLQHFYSAFFFTNTSIDNYMKRLVRDSLHYNDDIFCAAGKVIESLRREHSVYSSWHVRRGDFQYKETRIGIEEWYNNTKDFLLPGEALYIATDEKNKTFFKPLTETYGHPVKYFDDYKESILQQKIDSACWGMIESIVASSGRTFTGTWFSTFTGYINRLRGYRGMSMTTSWFSYSKRRTKMHNWEYPNGNYFAREWPIAWVGIDGDELIEHESNPTEIVQQNTKKIKPAIMSNMEDDHDDNVAEVEAIERKVPKLSLDLLKQDVNWNLKPVARGISGRRIDQTPAVVGAIRAHVQCDINVDSVAYWNNPQGKRDQGFKSPFAIQNNNKYITFGMDQGGWNNIRMSMEIIFVIAFITGRTLVLPPEASLYLLHNDKGHKTRSFADFFPLHNAEFQSRLKIITMSDFIKKEGISTGLAPLPQGLNRSVITKASEHCAQMAKSDRSCFVLNDYLMSSGINPSFRAADDCLVFDVDTYQETTISQAALESTQHFCGVRDVIYFNKTLNNIPIIHFPADNKAYRLLSHFYSILHFTDPAIENYVKRFVRDFLHYHDAIYCAAGKIVKALQYEGLQRGHTVDEEGAGGYSALHIRRGDLQFKKVKIPAKQWWNNTKELWKENEILYIASDEKNRSWFNPIAKRRDIRFLSDYWELADLGKLDPNYMGMIDTIVASRGRIFAGTWFSTFSGYINRMRGYHGMSMLNSWYSFLPRKTRLHNWTDVDTYAYAYEWPEGWIGIDADVPPTKESF